MGELVAIAPAALREAAEAMEALSLPLDTEITDRTIAPLRAADLRRVGWVDVTAADDLAPLILPHPRIRRVYFAEGQSVFWLAEIHDGEDGAMWRISPARTYDEMRRALDDK